MSSFEIKCPLMFDMSFNVTVCGQPLIPVYDPDPTSAETTDDTVTFSFDQPSGRLEHTKPVSLTLPVGTIPVNSWTLVLKECVSYAIQNNRKAIESLRDAETPFRKSVLFSSTPGNMRKPEKLASDLYMETHFSAFDIVKNVCGLMAYCGFPLNEFSIACRVKSPAPPVPESKADAGAIIRVFKRICEASLGKRLNFGTFADTGHALQSIPRTKPVSPSPLVMLYALYKFAEKCGGYWEFPLSRLMDFTVEAAGVSPAQIFALSRDEMEAILNGLARTNPDFVTFTTTHDLELVRLADDKTSADVLKLFGEG